MVTVVCASADCKWCDEDNYCTAGEIHLNDMSIMTLWEGRQHLWRCKQYEMSDRAKQMFSDFDRLCRERMNADRLSMQGVRRSGGSGDGILPLLRHAELQADHP